MKRSRQILFTGVFSVCCFLGICVSANDYDFFEEKSYTGKDAESLARAELQLQIERARKLGQNLDDCSYLEILQDESGIFTKVEELEEETVETVEEKNDKVLEHESNGYVVNFEPVEDSGATTTYAFVVENGIIRSAKVDEEDTSSYNDSTIESILEAFKDEDTDNYRIVYSVEEYEDVVDEEKIVSTKSKVESEMNRLSDLGYQVGWKQNNLDESSSKTIVSEKEKTEAEIIAGLEEENTGKEVKDVSIKTTKPSKYASEKNLDKAVIERKKAELEAKGIYDYISEIKEEVVIDTDKRNAIKVNTDKIEYTGIVDFENPYEDVLDNDGKVVGYKYFWEEKNVLISAADSFEKNFLDKDGCSALEKEYQTKGYKTTCTKVTNTTLEESEEDIYYFNDNKQDTYRRWSHLDISVGQDIVIYNEDGTKKATVEGTITSAPKGWINKGKNNSQTITYKNYPSSDSGRLEYRSKTDSDFTSNDLITLELHVRYTYNNVVHNKKIVLEGYLRNIFNVCKEKNRFGGGFDVEINISIDSTGEHVVNFVTEEVWTFNASKDAEYADKTYYDEYKYATNTFYYVEAEDIHYTYNVTYLATDYTVFWNGNTSLVNVVKNEYDKDYVIDGSKTTYTAKTVAVIRKREMCEVGDEGEKKEEVILPPHTDSNVILSNGFTYNFVTTFEDKKKKKNK